MSDSRLWDSAAAHGFSSSLLDRTMCDVCGGQRGSLIHVGETVSPDSVGEPVERMSYPSEVKAAVRYGSGRFFGVLCVGPGGVVIWAGPQQATWRAALNDARNELQAGGLCE